MAALKKLFGIVGLVVLSACGGGGGGEAALQGPQPTSGTVTITVGDGPTDDFSQIIMVIDEIRFLSDSGQDILVLDEPKTIDFLQVRNFSEVLIKREVVAGTFSKIRLILDRLTVVDHAGVARDVALHGLRKVDINPRGTFSIRGGEEIVIDIDVDLDKSIHIVSTGNNQLRFRPVIFATINATPAFDKLFRLEGTVDELSSTTDSFRVCDIRRATDDEPRPNPREVCVDVDPTSDTSFFDSEGLALADGDALADNDPVVIYGKFAAGAAADTLTPAVVAIGTHFVRRSGIAGSDFRSTTEDFDLDQVNDACLLQPDVHRVTAVEETPVFQEDADRNALRVTRDDIDRCLNVEAEGFAVSATTTEDEFLRAFIVLLGDSAAVIEDELTGTLTSGATPDRFTLSPADGSAQQCVLVDDDTEIIEVVQSSDGAVVEILDEVPTGTEVSVIGFRDDASGCLAADSIVSESGP